MAEHAYGSSGGIFICQCLWGCIIPGADEEQSTDGKIKNIIREWKAFRWKSLFYKK